MGFESEKPVVEESLAEGRVEERSAVIVGSMSYPTECDGTDEVEP